MWKSKPPFRCRATVGTHRAVVLDFREPQPETPNPKSSQDEPVVALLRFDEPGEELFMSFPCVVVFLMCVPD